MLTEPAFRPHEVDAERQVILEEILMNQDVPEDHVHTLLAEALFPGHPLGREVLGTRETVEAATRDQIADFFGRWYLPRNLVVVAAGDLDHDRLVEAPRRPLGRLEGGERPVRDRPEAAVEPLARCSTTPPSRRTWPWAGGRSTTSTTTATPSRSPTRSSAGACRAGCSRRSARSGAVLLGVLLGLDLRRRRHGRHLRRHRARHAWPSCCRSSTTRSPSWWPRASPRASSTWPRATSRARLVLGLEDSGSRMARLGRSLMARDEIVPVDEQLARIRAVTADDVAAVSSRVFGSPRALAVVGHVDPSLLP